MQKYYKILDGSGDIVREEDIEGVLCGSCRGELKKVRVTEEFYGYKNKLSSLRLVCQKCGGYYNIKKMTKKEATMFIRYELAEAVESLPHQYTEADK